MLFFLSRSVGFLGSFGSKELLMCPGHSQQTPMMPRAWGAFSDRRRGSSPHAHRLFTPHMPSWGGGGPRPRGWINTSASPPPSWRDNSW